MHLDDDAGVIDIRRGSNQAGTGAPTSLIPHDINQPGSQSRGACSVLAEHVLEARHRRDWASYRAARDLLMRESSAGWTGRGTAAPRCGRGSARKSAHRLVASLDESYLAIQGPPGSGKSTVGAEMIVNLVAKGHGV